MSKSVKYIVVFAGLIGVFICMIAILLIIFVHSSHLKSFVSFQVKQYTGCELIIDDNLSFTLFSDVGFKVKEIQLKDYFDATDIIISVKLIPLLRGRIEVKDIFFGNIKWNHQTQAFPVCNIKNMRIDVDPIDFTRSFPVTISFDFFDEQQQKIFHTTFTAEMFVDLSRQIYLAHHVNVMTEYYWADKKIPISAEGNLKVDLKKQTLIWSDFIGQVANLKCNGKLNVKNIMEYPTLTGYFSIQPFNMNETPLNILSSFKAVQVMYPVQGDVDIYMTPDLVDIQSDIDVENIKVLGFVANHMHLKTRFQNDTFNIESLTSHMYQGSLYGQGTIHFSSGNPEISAHINLFNIRTEALLQDIASIANSRIKISGSGNLDLQIATSCKDVASCLGNLIGTAVVEIASGTLQGMDLLQEEAFKGQNSLMMNDMRYIHFKSLKGSASIHNGILVNDDLLLESPQIRIEGKGTVAMLSQGLNYALNVSLEDQNVNASHGSMTAPVSILIRGSVMKPIIAAHDTA